MTVWEVFLKGKIKVMIVPLWATVYIEVTLRRSKLHTIARGSLFFTKLLTDSSTRYADDADALPFRRVVIFRSESAVKGVIGV